MTRHNITSDANAHASAHLRTYGYDWFIAFHYAPAVKRSACVALFAFLVEVARIRSVISDPMPGEIRLQWWRDTLTGTAHGAVNANPLAAALLDAIAAYDLPVAPLLSVLDGRQFDLYDDAFPTLGDFEGYAGEVWSSPMSVAASLLSGESARDFADVAGHGGVAYTVATSLADILAWSGRNQCFFATKLMADSGFDRASLSDRKVTPELTATLRAFASYGLDHLDKAARAAGDLTPDARPVFLPLALTRSMLQEADRWAAAPFSKPLQRPKWQRLYALWRASKRMPYF